MVMSMACPAPRPAAGSGSRPAWELSAQTHHTKHPQQTRGTATKTVHLCLVLLVPGKNENKIYTDEHPAFSPLSFKGAIAGN